MGNSVNHGKRQYKQMALEVAVRNPERYEGILRSFEKNEGIILNDKGILEVYSQLYLDSVVSANKLSGMRMTKNNVKKWIKENLSHNNEWGFPTGYQAAFTRYLKTLSEFGFIYAQYNEELRLSPIAKAVVSNKISLSEAFAVQSMRFWRKSPYRRVLNDFNFFEFIIDTIIELKKCKKRLSINQFNVGLFSDDGNVDEFLHLLNENKIGDSEEKAYDLVKCLYDSKEDHAKVSMMNTAFRDYGNTVFRVLQLTGFVTVDYKGVLMLSPNENRMKFYKALKSLHFCLSEESKEDEKLYFNEIGSFGQDLENIVLSYREEKERSTENYNSKICNVIKSYHLKQSDIERMLTKIALEDSKGRDCFWFIQAPVKLEFLLTLYAYCIFGDRFTYKPNFICDEAGIPYSHAPGNIGDIEIFDESIYWLIEATLIRSKTQQVNNETVNLFRHLNESNEGDSYLTLIAPYIHDDTKLIFKVASLITMLKSEERRLYSDCQSIVDFIGYAKSGKYFPIMKAKTKLFIAELKAKLYDL